MEQGGGLNKILTTIGFFEIFFLCVFVVSFSVSSLFWIDSCCYKLLLRENILGDLKEKILWRLLKD